MILLKVGRYYYKINRLGINFYFSYIKKHCNWIHGLDFRMDKYNFPLIKLVLW